MSQELFVSVNQLIDMSEAKGSTYDHVVIESSGISEPKSVRAVFQDAESYEMQLMDKVWYYTVCVDKARCQRVFIWVVFRCLCLQRCLLVHLVLFCLGAHRSTHLLRCLGPCVSLLFVDRTGYRLWCYILII